jgi:hypothetical protein
VAGGTFYARFRRNLKLAGMAPTGIHVLRHTAAKLRRDAGESIEEVSSFLDHSSLAVTTVYLRRLEGQEDRTWRDVAVAIGVGLSVMNDLRHRPSLRTNTPSAAISAERSRTRWVVLSPMPDKKLTRPSRTPELDQSSKRRWPGARPSATLLAGLLLSVPRPWASKAAPRRAPSTSTTTWVSRGTGPTS